MTFITHARTLYELRDEFLSDLHRRLTGLDSEQKYEKRVGRLMAIARTKQELENVLAFWQEIDLRGAPKPKPESKLEAATFPPFNIPTKG